LISESALTSEDYFFRYNEDIGADPPRLRKTVNQRAHKWVIGFLVERGEVMVEIAVDQTENISLCETLDRVLNKGAVVTGDITISVADVDLLYLQLNLVLTSIETARRVMLPGYDSSSSGGNP